MQVNDYDIVGYKIISPLHLAVLIAYASRYIHSEKTIRVLVVIARGPWGKNLLDTQQNSPPGIDLTFIDEEHFQLNRSKLWPLYLLLKPLETLASRHIKYKSTHVCSPTLASMMFSTSSLRRLLYCHPVVLDEGIGSFNSRQLFQQEAKKRSTVAVVRTSLFWTYTLLWKNISLFGGERASLFRFENGKPYINDDIANSYKTTFVNNYMLRNTPTTLKPNTILILTQPFSEMGICSKNELFTAAKKMAEAIKQMGAIPVIKTHPVEAPDKYDHLGIERLNYDGPAEEIFATSSDKIREVWGYNSTSLITGCALFGLKTVSVRTPFFSNLSNMIDREAISLYSAFTETRIQN